MRVFHYPATVKRDRASFHLVTFPDVPEAGTDAKIRKEALYEATDALVVALGGYLSDRRPIPYPSRAKPGQVLIALPALMAAKLALYEAMREGGIGNIELGRALGSAKMQSGDCWTWIIALVSIKLRRAYGL